MTSDVSTAGIIYQGDFDTWTFTATQGDYIALSVGTVTQTTAHFAPWIRLVSPTGALLSNRPIATRASLDAAPACGEMSAMGAPVGDTIWIPRTACADDWVTATTSSARLPP